jgi:LuxR family maltose regulon positive regulatory protein
MAPPLLITKLYVPVPRPGVVPRPHLIARLQEGLLRGSTLTLISAPAGFGKTTVVSEWIAASGRPVAWLSLDEADGDPPRFLAYLIAALRTVAPQIGDGLLDALQSAQPPPAESILTSLLNEIAALPQPIVLVLDDYHAIDAEPVDRALAFLLDHLPPQLHLAITTREDPRLPLARLRARRQLTEVRAAGLRFTPEEAAAFFNQAMGLDLSEREVAALEARTEGWVAGLQLAALSMQGRDDVPGFIDAFAGDDRYIVDYLVEEVLGRQSERVRLFLLHTDRRWARPWADVHPRGARSSPRPRQLALASERSRTSGSRAACRGLPCCKNGNQGRDDGQGETTAPPPAAPVS